MPEQEITGIEEVNASNAFEALCRWEFPLSEFVGFLVRSRYVAEINCMASLHALCACHRARRTELSPCTL